MSDLEFIQKFLNEHIQDYDFQITSKPTITGNMVIFQASIDKAQGGNYCTSGWEFDLTDAIGELVDAIQKLQKAHK